MSTKRVLVALTAMGWILGCSGTDTQSGGSTGGSSSVAGNPGIAGSSNATGGTGPGAGGSAAAGGNRTTGGATSAATGGTTSATGGKSNPGASTGGAVAATGGSKATGGAVAATGGAVSATGGSIAATGGSKATGGATVAATGGRSATGGASATGGTKATGGTAAGGSSSAGGACTITWAPPATWTSNGKTFNTQPDLDAVWDYLMQIWKVENDSSWFMDKIIANGGHVNYCVRIDLVTTPGGESTVISEAQRTQIQQSLETWLNDWYETWMAGWGCWPYGHIPVNIVGWAVKSASTLSGTVDSGQQVYVNNLDSSGVPQCPTACYYQPPSGGSYSGCTGGAANHFDMSLWLEYGMGFLGYGGDWGEQVNLQDFLNGSFIVAHEMGHGSGLPDFYSGGAQDFYTIETSADAQALSGAGFIMQAGSAATVTEFDGWMLRQNWYKFEAARHGY